jgi:carbon monoxide dehydrogenase subunit G
VGSLALVPSFSHSIELSQPPEAVFPWLLEEDKVPRWTSGLSRYEQDSPLRAGAHVRQVLALGGSDLALDLELTRYEPPRAVETKTSTNGVNLVIAYQLAANGGGTRLTQTLEAKAGSLTARMLIPVVQGRLEKKVTGDLARLKEELGG